MESFRVLFFCAMLVACAHSLRVAPLPLLRGKICSAPRSPQCIPIPRTSEHARRACVLNMDGEGEKGSGKASSTSPEHSRVVERALQRRSKRAQSPRARGWYKKRHKTITKGQRAALQRNWDRFGVDVAYNSTLDLDSYWTVADGWSGTAPPHTVLNIGFGKGEDLVQMSGQMPDSLFFGIEIHRASIACALADLEAANRSNVRVCRADATRLLRHHLPPGCLDQAWLFFPDPWGKPGDEDRRVLRLCPPPVSVYATSITSWSASEMDGKRR
jgi:tRNA G46 methylase TrmB